MDKKKGFNTEVYHAKPSVQQLPHKMHQTWPHDQRTTSDTRLSFMGTHHNLHDRLDPSPLGMTLSLSLTTPHINLMSGLY